tara:strand:- start:1474 stop:1647 length:174 start_codon:yes stop_codon:yes gene_type:complete
MRRKIFSNFTVHKKTEKKTRQGQSKHTKSGTKPNTDALFVCTKSLRKYKKAYRGQGK